MKKEIKNKKDLFRQDTYPVTKSLNKLDPRDLAPEKMAHANELLRKLKTPLPK
jgi:hypothetical protein